MLVQLEKAVKLFQFFMETLSSTAPILILGISKDQESLIFANCHHLLIIDLSQTQNAQPIMNREQIARWD